MKMLPSDFRPYTDTYFLRSLEILQKEHLNPVIRAQIFLRSSGKIAGISDAIDVLKTYSQIFGHGGSVYSLSDGDDYESLETVMVIEGFAKDVIPFETMMLGLISSQTTRENDKTDIDLGDVTKKAREIVELVGTRPILYFGARHWSYERDFEISKAAFDGGVTDASTDIGASIVGKKGVGTIPHSLECIYAWKYGMEHAVLETTKAFNRVIDPSIPRVALVDFNNKEVSDSLAVAKELGSALFGIRIDTSGEHPMQRVTEFKHHKHDRYWSGFGVTIGGVYSVRKALDDAGFDDLKITLTSGFADLKKVHAFVQAEEELGIRLFDLLGVGQLFHSRAATMDIVGVGESLESMQSVSKAGRTNKPNSRLLLRELGRKV